MNILFIQSSNAIGGAEMSLIDLIKYLSKNKINCFVVLKKCKKNTLGNLLEQELGSKIFYFKSIPSIPIKKVKETMLESLLKYIYKLYKNGPDFMSILKLKKIVKENNISIIHSNVVYPRLGNVVAKNMNIPHIQHLRELTGGIGGIVNFKLQENPNKFKSIYGTHHGIIANSNFCLDSNKPWYSSIHKLVMYNSVGKEFFNLPLNKTKHKIGLVANVTSKWKRHDLFIKLAEIYNSKYNSELEFNIYGNLPNKFNTYHQKLENSIVKKKLNNIVKFMGSIDSIEIYKEIKLLIHCCPTEPFGRIFIEAGASGVPVLALSGGGASEIVNNDLGYLYDKNNLNEMAEKLNFLIENENERLKIAKSARKEAIKYRPEIVYRNLIPFYKKTLNKITN